jgi:hypothetical protein
LLATTKALSLATLAAGLGGSVLGVITLLQIMADRYPLGGKDLPWIAIGFAERLLTTAAALICLALTWLLVALGAARGKADDIFTQHDKRSEC